MKTFSLIVAIIWAINAVMYGFGFWVAPAWWVGCLCGLLALEDFCDFLKA